MAPLRATPHPVEPAAGTRQAADVVAAGDLDWQRVPDFRSELLSVTGSGRDLVVDLTAVTYLSSLAVGALVAGIRDARTHGRQVKIHVAGATIAHRVLTMCQIPCRVVG